MGSPQKPRSIADPEAPTFIGPMVPLPIPHRDQHIQGSLHE